MNLIQITIVGFSEFDEAQFTRDLYTVVPEKDLNSEVVSILYKNVNGIDLTINRFIWRVSRRLVVAEISHK